MSFYFGQDKNYSVSGSPLLSQIGVLITRRRLLYYALRDMWCGGGDCGWPCNIIIIILLNNHWQGNYIKPRVLSYSTILTVSARRILFLSWSDNGRLWPQFMMPLLGVKIFQTLGNFIKMENNFFQMSLKANIILYWYHSIFWWLLMWITSSNKY